MGSEGEMMHTAQNDWESTIDIEDDIIHVSRHAVTSKSWDIGEEC